MRDQWRVDDDNRHLRDRREREQPSRRARSPILSPRPEGANLGLKIKGRATAESAPQTVSRQRERSRSPRRDTSKTLPPTTRRQADGEGSKRSRELSEERLPKRNRTRDTSPPTRSHRRSRSTTPDYRARAYHGRRRDQDRSPTHTDRGVNPTNRRRDRAYSPPFSPRRDNYLPSRERLPAPQGRSVGDSYIPSLRGGRSRSPKSRGHYRPEVSRRYSRSPERYQRRREDYHSRSHVSRRESPHRGRKSSPSVSIPRERSIDSSTTQKEKGSKSSRRSEKQKLRTLKHLVNKPKKPARNTSPSPIPTAKDDQRMQSSTRPIQSILDEQPRQPSPPRPIPSFDDSNGSVDSHIRDAFPMHGMKASDIHPGQRRIPSHIDTRQPFASSPQYMTPTSSHQGSSQSGSPYSRGGWGSQQHFHAQPG